MSVSYSILCAGDFPTVPQVRDALLFSDIVVCCDGAVSALLPFRTPDYVVGDMDSCPDGLKQILADKVITVSEQESNDLSKAFRFVCSHSGIDRNAAADGLSVTVYGASGKREDHAVGNMSLMADFAWYLRERNAGVPLVMLSDYGMTVPLTGSCRLRLPEGQPVSVFAFDPSLRLRSKGLEYPTDGVCFDMWWKATLNRVAAEEVELEMSVPAKMLLYLPGLYDRELEVTRI